MRGKTMPQFLEVDEGVAAALASNVAPVVHRRPGRQRRRRRAVRQHDHPAPPDRAQRRGRRRSGRSGTRSRCGCASMPARARRFPLRFGGKIGPASGAPVDATRHGDAAGARLLAELRADAGAARRLRRRAHRRRRGRADHQPHAGAGARAVHAIVGIDPRARSIVVVKSTNHFMAAFGPIAKQVIYVESDGPLSRDYRKIPYTRVQRPDLAARRGNEAGADLLDWRAGVRPLASPSQMECNVEARGLTPYGRG